MAFILFLFFRRNQKQASIFKQVGNKKNSDKASVFILFEKYPWKHALKEYVLNALLKNNVRRCSGSGLQTFKNISLLRKIKA